MGWRDEYKVHPAADVFPMMSDEELAALGEDIKKNELQQPIEWWDRADGSGDKIVIDGRNRLEAMERAGIPAAWRFKVYYGDDPTARIISLNIHRRHLTKQQQADLIVAAHKAAVIPDCKPRQRGEVSKGGRGHVDKLKADIVATAGEYGISKRTAERSIAKSEGRTPQPGVPQVFETDSEGHITRRLTEAEAESVDWGEDDDDGRDKKKADGGCVTSNDINKPLNGMTALEWIDAGMPPAPEEPEPEPEPDDDVDAIFPENYRKAYIFRASGGVATARECAKLFRLMDANPPERQSKKVKEDRADMLTLTRAAAKEWAELSRLLEEKQASTLPQDGRSEVPVGDPIPDLPDIPPELDRRKKRA